MKAMILAAGYGKRMQPLTHSVPKPLLCASGKPLIEYHLENLARAQIHEVIINVAYLGEKIRSHLGDGRRFNLQISYSEEVEPLETGGAILHAQQLLGDKTFLLINGDVWCDLEFTHFIQHPLLENSSTDKDLCSHPNPCSHNSALAHLLLVPNPDFHPLGDFALNDNGLLLEDQQQTHPKRFTFGGISLIQPELILNYPKKRSAFPLVEALRYAIHNKRITGELHQGGWSDVGTPERLQALNNTLTKQ